MNGSQIKKEEKMLKHNDIFRSTNREWHSATVLSAGVSSDSLRCRENKKSSFTVYAHKSSTQKGIKTEDFNGSQDAEPHTICYQFRRTEKTQRKKKTKEKVEDDERSIHREL